MIDYYYDKNVLVLPMRGDDGGTSFVDISPLNKTVSRFGNTVIKTAPSLYGDGCGYFDGTGDYLTVPGTDYPQLFGYDFTVEMRVKSSSSSTTQTLFSTRGTSGSAGGYIRSWNSRNYGLLILTGSTERNGGYIALPDDSWHHVAWSMVNQIIYRFLDGVPYGSPVSWTYVVPSADQTTWYVGATNSTAWFHTGYIQDLRVTQGIGRYTEGFTPADDLRVFTRNEGSISGTVKEKVAGNYFTPGAYPVRVYRKDNGFLAADVMSSEDGAYTVSGLPIIEEDGTPIEYFVVALDAAEVWQSPGFAEGVFPE